MTESGAVGSSSSMRPLPAGRWPLPPLLLDTFASNRLGAERVPVEVQRPVNRTYGNADVVNSHRFHS